MESAKTVCHHRERSSISSAEGTSRWTRWTRAASPWLLQTEDWIAVPRRFPPRRYPPEENFAHVAWLHRFLDRLEPTGFPAPRPLRVLNDASMAVVDGAMALSG